MTRNYMYTTFFTYHVFVTLGCMGYKGCRHSNSKISNTFCLLLPFFGCFLFLNHVHLKLRLHYNELAQRTATIWRYLTFGDIRCYTLKKSDECDH